MKDHEDRWLLVAAAGLLSFVAMFDMGSMNVALPAVAADFGIGVGTAQLVVLGYQIPLVVALLPMGKVLDTRPLRSSVIAALVVFAGTGVLAACTPTGAALGLPWVTAVRVVQGVAGAVLFVAMPVLASRAVRPERRGTALSVTATLGPLGAVVGPALAGPVVDHFGWRSVLLLKVPVCMIAWALIRRHLSPDVRAARPRPSGTAAPVARSVLAVVVAVALLAQAASAAQLTTSIALQARGSTATTAGLVLLTLSAAMSITSFPAGRLVDRVGPRPVAVAGAVVVTVGLGLMITAPWTDAGEQHLPLAVCAAVVGVGMGLYGGPTQSWVIGSLPPPRVAAFAARMQLARSLGFVGGPLIASSLAGVPSLAGHSGPSVALAVAALSAAAGAALLIHSARTPATGKVLTT